MYRQYENPHELEKRIKEQERACLNCPNDPDEYAYLQELKERLNHAWEDMYEDDY